MDTKQSKKGAKVENGKDIQESAPAASACESHETLLLREQLMRAYAQRSDQDGVLWHVFGIFWGSNAILLIALFSSGDFPKNPFVGVIVSCVATLVSLIWYGVQRRALGNVLRLEEISKRIERRLEMPVEYSLHAAPEEELTKKLLERGPQARRIILPGILIATLAWITSAIAFLLQVVI